jgi:hypothetical protein
MCTMRALGKPQDLVADAALFVGSGSRKFCGRFVGERRRGACARLWSITVMAFLFEAIGLIHGGLPRHPSENGAS